MSEAWRGLRLAVTTFSVLPVPGGADPARFDDHSAAAGVRPDAMDRADDPTSGTAGADDPTSGTADADHPTSGTAGADDPTSGTADVAMPGGAASTLEPAASGPTTSGAESGAASATGSADGSRLSLVSPRLARAAMTWSPAVGLVLGIIAAIVMVASRIPADDRFGGLLSATLALATLALLTRGLHLDGLADTVDGLGSSLPKDRALAVMASPQIGALGAAALVFNLLLQVMALYSSLRTHRSTEALVLAVIVSRIAAMWGCAPGVPAARSTGLGAMVAGTVPRWVSLAWTVAAVGITLLIQAVDWHREAVFTWRGPIVATAAGLAVALLIRRHAVRRLGGITGDVLGAMTEVTTTVVLIIMSFEI